MFFKLKKKKTTSTKKKNNQAKQNLEVTMNFPYREKFQLYLWYSDRVPSKTQFSRKRQACFLFDNHYNFRSIYKHIPACFLKNTTPFVVPKGFFHCISTNTDI